MNRLRQRLQQECPPLYTALERSWEIANDKWLASIPTSAGSYNSAPHFRNIEGHLETLLVPSSASGKHDTWTVTLSPLELYLLLASVLFHDYGRVKDNDNHAHLSKVLLPQHYDSLGIPGHEIAESLGRIAVYHDPVRKLTKEEVQARRDAITMENRDSSTRNSKRMERLAAEKLREAKDIQSERDALSDITIEPYGRARELPVATLLALADHLDASATRTEPYFVRSADEIGFKGAFRRMVIGSSYDPTTQCIKTCLCNPQELDEKGKVKQSKLLPDARAELKDFAIKLFDENGEPSEINSRNAAEDEVLTNAPPQPNAPALATLYKLMQIHPNAQRKLFTETLAGKCQLIREPQKYSPWPLDYMLAIVLKDLKANRSFLKKIKDDLKDIGIPVADWLTEFMGKTYNESGIREEEPVFRENEFKQSVADCMLELSTFAFGQSHFSYEVLADSLRTDNISLVKLAVQQLARDGGCYIKNGQNTFAFQIKVENEDKLVDFAAAVIRAQPETWSLRTNPEIRVTANS